MNYTRKSQKEGLLTRGFRLFMIPVCAVVAACIALAVFYALASLHIAIQNLLNK